MFTVRTAELPSGGCTRKKRTILLNHGTNRRKLDTTAEVYAIGIDVERISIPLL